MLTIETQRIANGERHSCNGNHVDVKHDERFMTIYGMHGEVLGTIIRPRVLDPNRNWTIANKHGEEIPGTVFSARAAFCRFLRKELGLNVSLLRGTAA